MSRGEKRKEDSHASFIRAKNKKLTSGFLFLLVPAADVVGGWPASLSNAGADTWKCIIPVVLDVQD